MRVRMLFAAAVLSVSTIGCGHHRAHVVRECSHDVHGALYRPEQQSSRLLTPESRKRLGEILIVIVEVGAKSAAAMLIQDSSRGTLTNKDRFENAMIESGMTFAGELVKEVIRSRMDGEGISR